MKNMMKVQVLTKLLILAVLALFTTSRMLPAAVNEIDGSIKEKFWRCMYLSLNDDSIQSLPGVARDWLTYSDVQKNLNLYVDGNDHSLSEICKDLGSYSTISSLITFPNELREAFPNARALEGVGLRESTIKKLVCAMNAYCDFASQWFGTSPTKFLKTCLKDKVEESSSPLCSSKMSTRVRCIFNDLKGLAAGGARESENTYELARRFLSLEDTALSEKCLLLLMVASGSLRCAYVVRQTLEYILAQDPRGHELTRDERLLIAEYNAGKKKSGECYSGFDVESFVFSLTTNYLNPIPFEKFIAKVQKVQVEICFLQLLIACYNVHLRSKIALAAELDELILEEKAAKVAAMKEQREQRVATTVELQEQNRVLRLRTREAENETEAARARARQADNRADLAENHATQASNRAIALEAALAETNEELGRVRQEAEEQEVQRRGQCAQEQATGLAREEELRLKADCVIQDFRAESERREAELYDDYHGQLDMMENRVRDGLRVRLIQLPAQTRQALLEDAPRIETLDDESSDEGSGLT